MAEKEYIEREEISQYLKDRYEYYARKIKEAVYWDEAKAYRVLQVLAVDMFEYLGHRVPAADVAPVVHGEWVVEEERTGNYSHCSRCGIRCQGYAPNYKYCPNCGAKMDSKRKEATP